MERKIIKMTQKEFDVITDTLKAYLIARTILSNNIGQQKHNFKR